MGGCARLVETYLYLGKNDLVAILRKRGAQAAQELESDEYLMFFNLHLLIANQLNKEVIWSFPLIVFDFSEELDKCCKNRDHTGF